MKALFTDLKDYVLCLITCDSSLSRNLRRKYILSLFMTLKDVSLHSLLQLTKLRYSSANLVF